MLQALSDAAVFDYRDHSPPVLEFSRSTRFPTTQKVTKNHKKGIPGQKKSKGNSEEDEEEEKAKNTMEAACKKLEQLESETEGTVYK